MKKTIISTITLFSLITFLLTPSGLVSQTNPDLSDVEVKERLEHIQVVLDAGQSNANLWWEGWLIGYGAMATGMISAHFIITDDENLRQDMLVGGVTSGLGVLGQLIDPMVPGYAGDDLRVLPDGTAVERKAKLIQAEKLLFKSAQREIDGRSWLTHVIAGVVNLGSGLWTWLYYERPFLDGFISFAVGQAISEVQIFTQPTQAIDDYNEYKRKYGLYSSYNKIRYKKNWYVGFTPGRFWAGIYF